LALPAWGQEEVTRINESLTPCNETWTPSFIDQGQRSSQELDATLYARGYIADIPRSSPSITFFNGELVHFVRRHRIEGRDACAVAEELKAVFDEYCPVPARATA
jgi:hypothetical protein